MKAIVNHEYGSPVVLKLEEVEKPTPKGNEVLIKVHATSLNKADWYMLSGKPFMVRLDPGGLIKPKIKILGGDVAGRVEAVGKNVKQFQIGDEVFGDISDSGMGAFAEYVSVAENLLALKPANQSFEEAASVPSAAVTALQGIRDTGEIQPGQKVLIDGASGGVGTYALQIAKSYETEVTAVCSTGKIDMVRSIGADHVIDYTNIDFTQNGQHYDLIIGVNGSHSLSEYKRALNPNGTYVCIGGSIPHIFATLILGPLMSKKGSNKLRMMGSTKINQKDLVVIKELLEAGKIVPVIDRTFSLSEAAEAFRYFGEGHAKGKVVITVEHNNRT
jgi:NADPH:quinone reductase-like Zn-dependent oxidoreductase